jgi:hypothetical protein
MIRSTRVRIACLVGGAFLLGALAGAAFLGSSPGDGDSAASLSAFLERSGLLETAQADMADGGFAFLPNRHSVWVVNTRTGRMANYDFRLDEQQNVERTRVERINVQAFPPEDTVLRLSDRNLSNILWVCNKQTGDIEMWRRTRGGALVRHGPHPFGADLAERP